MLINLRNNSSSQDSLDNSDISTTAVHMVRQNAARSPLSSPPVLRIKSDPEESSNGNLSPLDFITPSVHNTYAYFQQHFPTVKDFQPPPTGVPIQMLSTFLLMYQSHSQRILDTFQLANVEELEQTITHFWIEMPPHLGQLLAHPFLLTLVECADTLLYRVSSLWF